MNKKYFFRGFGVGVLFVTVVFGISCLMHTSDSAVISRAKKLGMTFADSDNKIVYATAENASGSAVSDNNNAISDKDNDKQDDKKDVRNTPAPSPVVSKKKKKDRSFENEKKKMQKSLNEEKKKLTISSGDWAKKVADKLQDEGVIEDSEKFTEFMRQNGYVGKIRAGEYEFQKDEDFSEIAEMITNQKKAK